MQARRARGSGQAAVRTDGPTVIEPDLEQAVPVRTRMASPGELSPGDVLAGYSVEHEVGRGGMGVVYRARHLHLKRTAALKVLTPGLAKDANFRERFIRESRLAASLDHPNVVPVYDAGEAEELLYIAMRFVAGADLAELLESGPLPPTRALDLLTQVGSALDCAHEAGLVHRDVKPANVLVAKERAFLTDFGLSKLVSSDSSLTAAGKMVGTLDYVSPEQIRGEDVDGRSDVYALGCVLFHSLAGAAPYSKHSEAEVLYAHLEHRPPRVDELRLDLPEQLGDVLARSLEKEPEDRFQTCGELMDAAREAVGLGRVSDSAGPQPSQEPLLVVAEEGADGSLVAGALAGGRMKVTLARDSADALDRLERENPRLAIVMQGTEGLRTCTEMRAAVPDTRILLALPRSASAMRGAALAAGADDVIAWPFSSSQLLVKLRDLLGPEAIAR
jgi:serine/threonine-protein kinase